METLLILLLIAATLPAFMAVMAHHGSPLRDSALHGLTLITFCGFVVSFSALANGDVLDRLFYTQDLARASGVNLGSIFDSSVFVPRAGDDILYVGLLGLLSRFGTTTTLFFCGVAIVCLVAYLAPLRNFLAPWQVAFILILTVSMGIFTSYTSIVARQGIAMSLIFAGLVTVAARGRTTLGLAFLALGCLFHWSAIPFAIVAIIVLWARPRMAMVITAWAFFAALFLTDSQESVMGPFARFIPKYGNYTSSELSQVYIGGINRLDFLIASLGLGVLFLYFGRTLRLPDWYEPLVKVYWGMNSLFLLMGFVYYSDRLAAFSWFLAPLLLSAPVYAQESARARILGALVLLGSTIAGFSVGPYRDLASVI